MAQLEILQCSGCGSPLSPGALVCEYCGNKNVIRSKRNPLKIDSAVAQKYISFYAKKTADNPKDTNALYAMGLLYLNLKNYELAQRNFKDAIDQSPLDADMYYYYALSLIAGRCPKHLNTKEVVRIEQYINTAIGMETKCKYLVLLATVKEEYYVSNRLIVIDPSPRELFEQAQEYTPDDLDEIADHVVILSEGVKYSTDLLLGIEQEEDDDDDDDDADNADDAADAGNDADILSEEELEEAINLTEEQRKLYYDYRFEPKKPAHNYDLPPEVQLTHKPAYPIIERVWKLALSLLLSFIVLIVCAMGGWGHDEITVATSEPISAETIVKEREQEGTKLAKKERAQLIEKIRSEQIEKTERDSLIAANGILLLSETNSESEEVRALYLKKSASGVVWLILIILPLLIWLFTTILKVRSIASERSGAEAYNQRIKQEYEEGLELYQARPTDAQMRAYTMDSLSLVVGIELGYHEIDEGNLKGKTLFLNEYFTYKEDGENYDNSAIEYKVVLLEDDCVTVISSDWRIYEDMSATRTCESISYADITNVRLSEDELSFADVTIEIPDENVFEYQSDDLDDDLTFSNDRISDVREFKIALEKLVRAYKNSRNL